MPGIQFAVFVTMSVWNSVLQVARFPDISTSFSGHQRLICIWPKKEKVPRIRYGTGCSWLSFFVLFVLKKPCFVCWCLLIHMIVCEGCCSRCCSCYTLLLSLVCIMVFLIIWTAPRWSSKGSHFSLLDKLMIMKKSTTLVFSSAPPTCILIKRSSYVLIHQAWLRLGATLL